MKVFQNISQLIKSQPIARVHSRLLSQKSLYIGNIPFNLQREELEELVSQYGSIYRLNYPMDPLGRFKGIAFVNYEASQAEIAFKELSGANVKGRNLKVGWANVQPEDTIDHAVEQPITEGDMETTKSFENAEEDAKNKE